MLPGDPHNPPDTVTAASSPLHLAITAQALTHGGGAERYARDVVQGLLDLGITPVVIARKIDRALPQAQRSRCYALPLRGVPRLWRSAAFDWRAGRILAKEQPHCVFGINHTAHADVAICGGTHPGFLQAMGKRAHWTDRRQIALERRCYAHARRIVAHSQRMRDELLHYYDLPPARIDVLYPPVDTARFTPLSPEHRQQMRARLGFPADRVVFLLVSTGHARKGLAELMRFFADTTLPVCLAVAGRSVPQQARNVISLGYRQDIEAVYAAADYTVVASHYEPFGLVAVESVLCGTPVVIADIVGSAEVIADSAKITFPASDPANLSTALHTAYTQAQTRHQRLCNPAQTLLYDPSVATHVRQLLNYFQPAAEEDAV